jgi:hypothetical protein
LNLFPSPFKSEKSFFSQKLVLYSKRLLEEYQSWSNDLFDKTSKEPEITRLENNKVYLSKPKVASDSFLSKFKDANLRNMISKSWSRVKMLNVNNEQRDTIKIFYCDFGFESIISREEICIRAFPIISRIVPRFSYECTLNNGDLVKKLATIRSQNDFVDFNYLNDNLDYGFLSQIPLNIDFTESLEYLQDISRESSYLVTIYDKVTNQNIIDKIITNSLLDLKNHIFPCIVSHINSINDFYVQKDDPLSQEALNNLQIEIQNKVATNGLKKMEYDTVNINKLCVSIYHEDNQYYRAKIHSIFNSERKVKLKKQLLSLFDFI